MKRKDGRWEGKWKIVADLDELLILPIVKTAQRPDIVIWNEERRIVHLLELTVPWESNLELAEERKEARYDELLQQCEDQGWTASHSHLGVVARGYVKENHYTFSVRRWASQQQKSNNSESECRKQLKRRLSSSG